MITVSLHHKRLTSGNTMTEPTKAQRVEFIIYVCLLNGNLDLVNRPDFINKNYPHQNVVSKVKQIFINQLVRYRSLPSRTNNTSPTDLTKDSDPSFITERKSEYFLFLASFPLVIVSTTTMETLHEYCRRTYAQRPQFG